MRPERRRAATGVAAGALAIAAVTLVIAALKPLMDPSALTGLYLFAILPVAIGWGFWQAGVVALASYLTFEYFFVPPIHSFAIARPEEGAALAIALGTAYVVSELARRAHARVEEARARTRDAEEARSSQRRLTDEQAALRRVATLVARGLPTAETFEFVTREVALLCDADVARMERFEPDNAATAIASWARDEGARLAVGTRFALEGESIAAEVRQGARRRGAGARPGANRELRDLAHGLLPDALTRGGLAAGVESTVLGLRMPVDVSVPEDRFPPEIEASAYFVVAEALTNVAKHSGAHHAVVAARVEDGSLRIEVRDDGVGGARPEGNGLLGVRDRVVTLGGDLEVVSPAGGGTRIAVTLPLRR